MKTEQFRLEMRVIYPGSNGFSLIEISVAVAVFSLCLSSVLNLVAINKIDMGQLNNAIELAFSEYSYSEIILLHDESYLGRTFFSENYNVETRVRADSEFENIVQVTVRWMTERGEAEYRLEGHVVDLEAAASGAGCMLGPEVDWSGAEVVVYEDLFPGVPFTDIASNGRTIAISTDSAIAEDPDIHFFELQENSNALMWRGSLNTGPGIRKLTYARNYVAAANSSRLSQVQIIDATDLENPFLVSSYNSNTSGGPGQGAIGESVEYYKDVLYLGLIKNPGKELVALDARDVSNLSEIASYETGTQVSDIYIRGANVFVASPTETQLRVLRLDNDEGFFEISSLSLPSWQIHDGMSVAFSPHGVYLGRSAGNKDELHEVRFDGQVLTEGDSLDVLASVRDILSHFGYVLVATNSSSKEFQVYKFRDGHFEADWTLDLLYEAEALACVHQSVVVVTDYALYVITP